MSSTKCWYTISGEYLVELHGVDGPTIWAEDDFSQPPRLKNQTRHVQGTTFSWENVSGLKHTEQVRQVELVEVIAAWGFDPTKARWSAQHGQWIFPG